MTIGHVNKYSFIGQLLGFWHAPSVLINNCLQNSKELSSFSTGADNLYPTKYSRFQETPGLSLPVFLVEYKSSANISPSQKIIACDESF